MSVAAGYLPEAEDDVAAVYTYYEQQQAGLGDQFVEAVREVVDRIRSNPQLFGGFRRDIRAVPLTRFPYVVYYRDRGADVLIIAVQHGRRSSHAWRDEPEPGSAYPPTHRFVMTAITCPLPGG
jgi:plasmid stabilization system protein ParE